MSGLSYFKEVCLEIGLGFFLGLIALVGVLIWVIFLSDMVNVKNKVIKACLNALGCSFIVYVPIKIICIIKGIDIDDKGVLWAIVMMVPILVYLYTASGTRFSYVIWYYFGSGAVYYYMQGDKSRALGKIVLLVIMTISIARTVILDKYKEKNKKNNQSKDESVGKLY